jgi:hypothetical protein
MSTALVFSVESEKWQKAYRLANTLLRGGISVAWTLESKANLPAGSFLVPLETDAWPFQNQVPHVRMAAMRAASAADVNVSNADDQIDPPLLPLSVPRIALYGGGGSPYNYYRIFSDCGFLVEFLDPQAIRRGALVEFDVLAVPGGGRRGMKAQLEPLGEEGCRAIEQWVRDGGMYVGSCAGSFFAAVVSESFVNACPQQRHMQMINARVWNSEETPSVPRLRNASPGGLASPGVGVMRAAVVQRDHPVMFNVPDEFDIVHYHGPFFTLAPGLVKGGSEPVGLIRITGMTNRFTPSEYFLGVHDTEKIIDQTLAGRAIEAGTFTAVAGQLDRGRVVIFGSHPEFGLNLTMDAYGIGGILLANAVMWQSAGRSPREIRAPQVAPVTLSFSTVTRSVRTIADQVARRARELSGRSINPPPQWLRDSVAISTFGLPAHEIWRQTLNTFPRLLSELDGAVEDLAKITKHASQRLREESDPGLRQALRDALEIVLATTYYRVPETWNQDFGFEGILQHLGRCERMLLHAAVAWDIKLPPSPFPYENLEESPYHQIAGSYLAAGGVLADAVHLVQGLVAQIETILDEVAVQELLGSPAEVAEKRF